MLLLAAAIMMAGMAGQARDQILSPGPELYPQATQFPAEMATTSIELDIGSKGRAKSCRIIVPSGSSSLDQAACAIASGHFRLATNEAADTKILLKVRSPTRDTFTSDFDGTVPISPEWWVRPMDYPADAVRLHHQGQVRVSISVSAEGEVKGCRITGSSGFPELDAATCASIRKNADFLPALDPSGAPRPAMVTTTVNWTIPKSSTGQTAVTIRDTDQAFNA
ncbi:MAG TPA: energy transducer TonB [Sphingomonas sp.]|nr:energy transducer TonB [Sphingomonas sp.]